MEFRCCKPCRPSPFLRFTTSMSLPNLPKATLLRIFHTLEQSGLVMRRLGDGRYRMCTTLTRMVRKRDRYDRVAEAAAPVLDRFCQKISWASDLMVPAGDHMEIRETSRMRIPFSFGPDRIGTPVNWLLSGVGRAYLAFCPRRSANTFSNWCASRPIR